MIKKQLLNHLPTNKKRKFTSSDNKTIDIMTNPSVEYLVGLCYDILSTSITFFKIELICIFVMILKVNIFIKLY